MKEFSISIAAKDGREAQEILEEAIKTIRAVTWDDLPVDGQIFLDPDRDVRLTRHA